MLNKKDSIIILLGAGASVDAGIPHSRNMIDQIEQLVKSDSRWSRYKDLYNYIRSAIFYAEGIKGRFADDVQFNIERLVNTLDELAKKHEHPLYPFVGSWNPRLSEVVKDSNFSEIAEFKNLIVTKLINEWVTPQLYLQSNYFQRLFDFQAEYTFSLRVFTLNYDLCLEHNVGEGKTLECGFDSSTSQWDWRLFDDRPEPPNIFLYKLHGSTNWQRVEGNLIQRNNHSDTAELIFGTAYKLQYMDPFLFLAYEFRRWTLDDAARLIISIGYGFGDEHINGIIGQSLRNKKQRRVLAIGPCGEGGELNKWEKHIKEKLLLHDGSSQVICKNYTAKAYFEKHLCLDGLNADFPPDAEEEAIFFS